MEDQMQQDQNSIEEQSIKFLYTTPNDNIRFGFDY